MSLYFRVELFSWTHGAREAKSTSSYIAIQEIINLLEYPPKWGFLLLPLGYHVPYGRKLWLGETLAKLANDHKFAKVSPANFSHSYIASFVINILK